MSTANAKMGQARLSEADGLRKDVERLIGSQLSKIDALIKAWNKHITEKYEIINIEVIPKPENAYASKTLIEKGMTPPKFTIINIGAMKLDWKLKGTDVPQNIVIDSTNILKVLQKSDSNNKYFELMTYLFAMMVALKQLTTNSIQASTSSSSNQVSISQVSANKRMTRGQMLTAKPIYMDTPVRDIADHFTRISIYKMQFDDNIIDTTEDPIKFIYACMTKLNITDKNTSASTTLRAESKNKKRRCEAMNANALRDEFENMRQQLHASLIKREDNGASTSRTGPSVSLETQADPRIYEVAMPSVTEIAEQIAEQNSKNPLQQSQSTQSARDNLYYLTIKMAAVNLLSNEDNLCKLVSDIQNRYENAEKFKSTLLKIQSTPPNLLSKDDAASLVTYIVTQPITSGIFAGGAAPPKPSPHRILLGSRTCVVYLGPRNARYVRQRGAFVPLKTAQAAHAKKQKQTAAAAAAAKKPTQARRPKTA
jgi:hypothetical protein